jgi:putative CocE/NonD family hydrolase
VTQLVEILGPAPLDPGADEVHVRMRDGITLATDVYLGGTSSPRPAVLVRLPYDKSGRYTFMAALAPHFNERGYVLVVQDVRGKFRSGGETMPFTHEVTDGYDTLDWVAAQAWCNGIVGMFGDSYYGYTQWAAVASGHTALRAIVPRVTTADLGALWVPWTAGVPQLYGADYLAHYWLDNHIYGFASDWSRRPAAHAFDDAFAEIGGRSTAFDAVLRASRDPGSPAPWRWNHHPFGKLNIPVLHSVGWFDNIMPASMRDWTALTARAATRDLQYLIADETDHENYALSVVPVSPEDDHDSDEAALARLIPRYLGPALDFFDVTLNGADRSSLRRVRWYLGHDGWHEAQSWPPPAARELTLYLDSDAEALTATANGRRTVATWTHDPDNLVPSTVANPFAFLHEYPDESPVQARPDVLTFTTAPYDSPLDLAGPVTARLHLDSSGPSMHVHAKLSEVAPDGTARMLVNGQELVAAPDPERGVVVSMGHTGHRVRPGCRLRLSIASSDYPLYLWHPGTSENPWYATKTDRNKQTLVTGGAAPSSLTLTVLSQER